jgi:ElaB/YqjD/DUF883 family membrane-anchored ribosome-binding protein
MNTIQDKVKSADDYMAQKATGIGAERPHQTTDAGSEGGHQGNNLASGVVAAIGEKAHDVASAVSECATGAKQSVQQMAHSAADSMTHAKDAVVEWGTDAAKHSADYMRAGNDELSSVIRRNPMATLLVAIAIGFMLAKTIRV